ncbi:MAG: thioredoxin domain-containing protein [Anaerolineales bacterium]|nr:thioredoxin domain-containing protein [Anaerolineales bacterium]
MTPLRAQRPSTSSGQRLLGITIMLVLLSLLISACGNQAPLSQVETPATASAIIASPTAPLPTCLLLKILPGPGTPRPSDAVPILEGEHIFGPQGAPVTLIVYSDFQCPNCAWLAASLRELLATHPDDLRLVYRHLPLSGKHDKAVIAAQAVEAADLQGKFWQMHDLLYASQGEWSALTAEEFEAWAREQAAGLGLDGERFQADLMAVYHGKSHRAKVAVHWE